MRIFLILLLILFGSCNSKSTGSSLVINIGRPLANISLTVPSIDYGVIRLGNNKTLPVHVTYTGGVEATNIQSTFSGPFRYLGNSFPGTGGTCTSPMSRAACILMLEYAPDETGKHEGTLTFTYNNGSTQKSLELSIYGETEGILAFSSTTLAYGTIAHSTTLDKTVTIRHTGGANVAMVSALTPTAPYYYKGGSFPGTGGTCAFTTYSTGNQCTIILSFSPTVGGTYNSQFKVTYNDGVSDVVGALNLSGVAAQPATLTVDQIAGLNYGIIARGSAQFLGVTIRYASGGVPATAMAFTNLAAPIVSTATTCTSTLSSSTCSYTIRYLPTANGVLSQNITLSYHNGQSTQTINIPVLADVRDPASLSLNAGSNLGFSTTTVGLYDEQFYTVTNSGGVSAQTISLTGASAPFSFPSGSFSGGGTCSATLAAGQSCTVKLRYTPAVAGVQSASLIFSYNNGVSSVSSTPTISGTAVAPALLSFTVSSHNFGLVPVGGEPTYTYTLRNTGGVSASSITFPAPTAPMSLTNINCGSSLAVGSTCQISVKFSPTSTGSFSRNIIPTYNNGVVETSFSSTQSGTGVARGSISISSSYAFAATAVGGTVSNTFTVLNNGGYAVSSLSFSSLSAPYTLQNINCAATLAVSASCQVRVTYAPTSTGPSSGTETVSYNDGVAPASAVLAISGTAVSPALLNFNVASYAYASTVVGEEIAYTMTVLNSGGIAATGITFTGLNSPYIYENVNCGAVLNASSSCQVKATFRPLASGSTSGTLTATYNNGAVSTTSTIGLSGVALSPALISYTTTAYVFPTIPIGSLRSLLLKLQNDGGATATSLSMTGLSSPYSIENLTCGVTLASAQTCQIRLWYTPLLTGGSSSLLSVSYHDGHASQSLSKSLSGAAVNPGHLSISPSAYDFAGIVLNTPEEQTFTFTNDGEYAITDLEYAAGVNAFFTFKGGTYPGTGGDCTDQLNTNQTCDVILVFAPTARQAYNRNFTFDWHDGAQSQTTTLSLTGNGVIAGNLTTDVANYDFTFSGETIIVTFENQGDLDLTNLGLSPVSDPFFVSSYNCPATLTGGSICSLSLSFMPSGAGPFSETLFLTSDQEIISIPLTGN